MAQEFIDVGNAGQPGTGDLTRNGFIKTNSNFDELYLRSAPSVFIFVDSLEKLPTPISSVITLLDNYTYYFVNNLDLVGNRLVSGNNTTILGASSENCSITSTGLGVGIALLTSVYTTPVRHITFKSVDTAFDFNGLGNTMALDWTGVNVKDVPNVGGLKNFTNFIYTKGAFLNSKGMSIDGTFGTFAIETSLLQGDGLAGDLVTIESTAVCSIRFRIDKSSVVAFGSTNGIDVKVGSTIPDESFILDNVNFSGGGAYVNGLDESSKESLFIKCNPITNTFVNGQLYMQNNPTDTIISAISTFYKVLGTTTPSADNSRFLHSNNRLTCDAVIDRKYLIQCNLSFSSGNNKECEFGFYDSKLSAIRTPSRTKSTSNGGGKGENVSFMCVVDFVKDDYLEMWCANNTDTANINVTELNFVITEIG